MALKSKILASIVRLLRSPPGRSPRRKRLVHSHRPVFNERLRFRLQKPARGPRLAIHSGSGNPGVRTRFGLGGANSPKSGRRPSTRQAVSDPDRFVLPRCAASPLGVTPANAGVHIPETGVYGP